MDVCGHKGPAELSVLTDVYCSGVMHILWCRWAMLAAAGILFEDLLGHIGAGGPAARTPWFEAGKFEYFAPASTLTIIEFFLFAWVEIRRYQDMKKPGRYAFRLWDHLSFHLGAC